MSSDTPELRAGFYASTLKFERAVILTAWLKTESVKLFTPAAVVREQDPVSHTTTLKLVNHVVSPTLSLVVGEILHNLKGALDYLTSSIVANASGKKETRVHFPFYERKADFIGAKAGNRIAKVVPDVWDVIEQAIKPYGDEDGNRLLWSISRLNNDDKHRLLTVTLATGAAAGSHQADGRFGAANVFMLRGPGEMVIDRGLHVAHQFKVTSTLELHEPDAIGTVDLFPYLEGCAQAVHSVGNALQTHMFGDEPVPE